MFQVRHKDYGLYQGEFMSMDFWYPMSEMPEQGICRFPTFEDAEDFINKYDNSKYTNRFEFFIERFDEELNKRLKIVGINKNIKYCQEKN